jgi:hypothetical protein
MHGPTYHRSQNTLLDSVLSVSAHIGAHFCQRIDTMVPPGHFSALCQGIAGKSEIVPWVVIDSHYLKQVGLLSYIGGCFGWNVPSKTLVEM